MAEITRRSFIGGSLALAGLPVAGIPAASAAASVCPKCEIGVNTYCKGKCVHRQDGLRIPNISVRSPLVQAFNRQLAKNVLTSVNPLEPRNEISGDHLVATSAGIELLHNDKCFGEGYTIAMIDTGVREHPMLPPYGHQPIKHCVTFTQDDSCDDVSEFQHGTYVASILVGQPFQYDAGDAGQRWVMGVAPKARVISLKVNVADGDPLGSCWCNVENALKWILDNHEKYGIRVISFSGALGHRTFVDDQWAFVWKSVELIDDLYALGIPLVAAAGNLYRVVRSREGMSFPAIYRRVISVGATFDMPGARFYERYVEAGAPSSCLPPEPGCEPCDPAQLSCTAAEHTVPDRIAPFSQRLHGTVLYPAPDSVLRTKVVAPGALIRGAAFEGGTATIAHKNGTSAAAPVVAGALVLAMEKFEKEGFGRPSVRALMQALKLSGMARPATDRDEDFSERYDETDPLQGPYVDNVVNRGFPYPRLHAYRLAEELLKGGRGFAM
jgi:hypothetical protein